MLRIAYDRVYAHPLPEGHRFPMEKYELIPAQLLHEGCITADALFQPEICSDDIILRTHDANYVHDLNTLALTPQHIRRIGFPLTKELVLREKIITRGTIDCCRYAMDYGIAMNIAGGTHHAFANRGEGFCLLNDVGVAANHLLHEKTANRILVVDLDVHQGNGTAALFSHESRVFTFSMHGGNNYPVQKEQSDLDVPLPDGIQDDDYLALLEHHLKHIIGSFRPDFVFFISGVDVLRSDRYGKLALSMDGCRLRDRIVFETCRKHALPCVVSMGGGYSADVRIVVEAHCQTFREAIRCLD